MSIVWYHFSKIHSLRKEKLIMQKIIRIICSLSILLTMTACGKSESTLSEINPKINQKVVFIYQHTNYNDSYMNQGFYIDTQGNKVEYDLSKEDKALAEIDNLYTYLTGTYEAQGEVFLQESELSEYYQALEKIDLDYEVQEECVAADMGSYRWYGVIEGENKSLTFILLSEKGDWERTNKDKNVETILKILEK